MFECIILLAVIVSSESAELTPNLGDIRLNNHVLGPDGSVFGEPQIFGTDGSMSPTWSNICAAAEAKDEGHVICQQLGYQEAASTYHRPVNGSENIFFTDLVCNQNYPHILHCDHVIKNNSTPCGGENSNAIMTVKCVNPLPKPESPYPGQIALCPSDDQALQQHPQSPSLGIVSIYQHDQWGALGHDYTKPLVDLVTDYHGNLICQQNGFQKVVPGSVRTMEAYERLGYSFTSCTARNPSGSNGLYLQFSWKYTSQLSCQPTLYTSLTGTATDTDPCFGCCYKQPPRNFEGTSASFVVLQCMYDTFTVKQDNIPFGTKDKCAFETTAKGGNNITNYKSVCVIASTDSPKSQNEAAKLSITGAVMFAVGVLVVVTIWILKSKKINGIKKCCKWCKKKETKDEYKQLQEDKPNGES